MSFRDKFRVAVNSRLRNWGNWGLLLMVALPYVTLAIVKQALPESSKVLTAIVTIPISIVVGVLLFVSQCAVIAAVYGQKSESTKEK